MRLIILSSFGDPPLEKDSINQELFGCCLLYFSNQKSSICLPIFGIQFLTHILRTQSVKILYNDDGRSFVSPICYLLYGFNQASSLSELGVYRSRINEPTISLRFLGIWSSHT
jgi:hypothetical protein